MTTKGRRSSGPPSAPSGRTTADRSLDLLEQLLDERVRVAGDVVEVSLGVWAIHGSIPRDGEVILAEFARPGEARSVLDQLGPNR
jgi:hypothetical protein